MKTMRSLRSFRLTNLSGHCVMVKADGPNHIPDELYTDALAAGMVEMEEVTDIKDTPDTQDDQKALLDQAIIRLITRGDPDDFKNDGTPKANRVIAEMDPEAGRPTAAQIASAFEELQSNISLAND